MWHLWKLLTDYRQGWSSCYRLCKINDVLFWYSHGLRKIGMEFIPPIMIKNSCFLLHTVSENRLLYTDIQFSSVQLLSHVPNPMGWLQHARLPCPSPTPRVYSNSCPLSQWCHPTISSSVISFSSHLQSFPASGSFQMSRLFTSSGQSIGVQLQHQYFQRIFRTNFLSDGLVEFLAVQGTLKSLLQYHSSKASILLCSAFFIVQLSHLYMTTGKTIALTRWTFIDKVMSLLFNMLSRLVITFLPRSKCLLISWLQLSSAVMLEPEKIKSDTVSTVSPSISHE